MKLFAVPDTRPAPRALSPMQAAILTPTERLWVEDMLAGNDPSWTFAPAGVRRDLRKLINDKRLCHIVDRTFEGDKRVYQFVTLTPRGMALVTGGAR